MGSLSVRLDDNVQKKAEVILNELGVTNSDAVRMFYHKIVDYNGIPFPVRLERIPNDELQVAMKNVLDEKNLIKVGSPSDLKKYLLED